MNPSPATSRTAPIQPALAAAPKRSLNSAFEGPPDRRQKRKVTRACDTCKAKKAKCSGTQPCESCEKRGQPCLYEAHYSRGKPPTPITGYSTMPSPASPLSEALPQTRQETNVHPVTMVEQPVDVPSRNSPEVEVAGQYSDSTSGLSFLHRAWNRLSNQSSQVMSSLNSAEENQRLMSAGDKPFQDENHFCIPNIERARDLCTLYFDVCIATYRMLHRPTVEQWLQTVVSNSEQRGLPLWHSITRPRAAIVLAVLAVATFHEEKAKGSGPASLWPVNAEAPLGECDELFCEALRLTDAETGLPKLESAQARLVQVLYLLMSSRMNQAWYTFGHALQIISALGLHRREVRRRPSQKRDYIEEQCRRRTFWVAYTLDKYLGVIFGRPRHYHDDDIDQRFPDSVNDEDMTPTGSFERGTDDCHIDSLICHAKLAQIAEKISREVYSIRAVPDHERIAASHRLGRELRQWRAALPPHLGVINPSSLISSFRRQATALKLAYSHAVILAHRPFLLKNLSNHADTREMAKESISECTSAAQLVLESVDRMARDGRLFHAFWWTHYVCFCALVIVYVWAIQHSNNTSQGDDRSSVKLLDLAERCLTHLAQATASNSPSRRYSIILQELRLEAKQKTARRAPEPLSALATTDVGGNQLPPLQGTTPVEGTLWEPMFGSPINTNLAGMSNFLDDWQTTDWLELDSSAFVGFNNSPVNWMSDMT